MLTGYIWGLCCTGLTKLCWRVGFEGVGCLQKVASAKVPIHLGTLHAVVCLQTRGEPGT